MSDPEPCKYRYTPPGVCNQTYAEYLGTKFDIAQIVYSIIAAIVIVIVLTMTALVIKRKKGLRPLDSQKKMFLLSSGTALLFIFRCIDLFGWRDWMPTTLNQLSYDWGSCCIYTVVYLVVEDWLRVILKTMAKGSGSERFVHITFTSLIAFTWIFYTICSLGQANAEPYWGFRATKLICASACVLCAATMQTIFGVRIWLVLRKNEKMWHRRTPTAINSPRALGNGPKAPTSPSNASLSGATSTEALNPADDNVSVGEHRLQRKSSKVNRILKLLVLADILELLSVFFSIYAASGQIADKSTLSRSKEKPETMGDILLEAAFDIIQAVAVLLVCWFFRPTRAKRNDEESSSTNNSKRSSLPKGGKSTRQLRTGTAGTDFTQVKMNQRRIADSQSGERTADMNEPNVSNLDLSGTTDEQTITVAQ